MIVLIDCFVAGTMIASSVGLVPIEDIKSGDKVWATNPETGETALKEVVQTFRNEANELVHVTVNGEEIICTPTHPFYVPVKGWTVACELRAGDRLQLVNGEYVVIEQVQHEILETPVTVYNFEVADFHTYYVGDTGVLVHNKCIANENGVKIEVRTSNEHGLPHAHISGNGPNTTVGLNGTPMRGYPDLSKRQQKIVTKYWVDILDGITKFFPKTH